MNLNNITSKEQYSELTDDQKTLFEDLIREEYFHAVQEKDTVRKQDLKQKLKLLSDESQAEVRNITHQYNRAKIQDVIIRFINEKNRFPSVLEIQHELDVSHTTIYKHLNEIREEGFNDEEMKLHEIVRNNIKMAITKGALKGELNTVKFYFQMFPDNEKKGGE